VNGYFHGLKQKKIHLKRISGAIGFRAKILKFSMKLKLNSPREEHRLLQNLNKERALDQSINTKRTRDALSKKCFRNFCA
jgi:hypothetical protein